MDFVVLGGKLILYFVGSVMVVLMLVMVLTYASSRGVAKGARERIFIASFVVLFFFCELGVIFMWYLSVLVVVIGVYMGR